MGCCKVFLLMTSALMCGLAYLMYQPVYDGYNNSFPVRKFLTKQQIIKLTSKFTNAIGYETYMNTTRWLFNIQTSPIQHISDGVESEDFENDGISMRIYRPAASESRLPAAIYFHGGGWTICNIDTHDGVARRLARDVGVVVISVEYRLAPEHPFPVPFDDCLRATLFLLRHGADKFNFDSSRVALSGDSAGGNLAAAVSIKLREYTDIIRPKLQVLMYPALQAYDFNLPSYQQYEYNQVETRELMIWYWALYAEGHLDNTDKYFTNDHVSREVMADLHEGYLNYQVIPEKLKYPPYRESPAAKGDSRVWQKIQHVFQDPLFNPLIAKNLSGLPTAYIVTAEYDLLRDDGFLYARRLREAGVKVIHDHLDNAFHIAHTFGPQDDPIVNSLQKKVSKKFKELLF